jgi:hypothetical protein
MNSRNKLFAIRPMQIAYLKCESWCRPAVLISPSAAAVRYPNLRPMRLGPAELGTPLPTSGRSASRRAHQNHLVPASRATRMTTRYSFRRQLACRRPAYA